MFDQKGPGGGPMTLTTGSAARYALGDWRSTTTSGAHGP